MRKRITNEANDLAPKKSKNAFLLQQKLAVIMVKFCLKRERIKTWFLVWILMWQQENFKNSMGVVLNIKVEIWSSCCPKNNFKNVKIEIWENKSHGSMP